MRTAVTAGVRPHSPPPLTAVPCVPKFLPTNRPVEEIMRADKIRKQGNPKREPVFKACVFCKRETHR